MALQKNSNSGKNQNPILFKIPKSGKFFYFFNDSNVSHSKKSKYKIALVKIINLGLKIPNFNMVKLQFKNICASKIPDFGKF